MLGAIVLNMPKRPNVDDLTKYYADSMMIPLMSWFCRMSAKNKFSEKDIESMKKAQKLKASERNPYSWNMDYYEYDDASRRLKDFQPLSLNFKFDIFLFRYFNNRLLCFNSGFFCIN